MKCKVHGVEMQRLALFTSVVDHCTECEKGTGTRNFIKEATSASGIADWKPKWHITVDPAVPPNQIRIVTKWFKPK